MSSLKHPYSSQAAASKFFSATTQSFQEIEDRLRSALMRAEITTKQQGDLFEVFCEAILRLHHIFAATEVWPIGRVPTEHLAALHIRSGDRGIDGIFRTNDGELVAYQAKFRSDGQSLTWTELATFIGLSERAERRLVVTNARGISIDASGRRDVTAFLGHELRALPTDMIRRACALIAGADASPVARLTPREHQRTAIDRATAALESAARCTLIMACGSGKSLTALWIAERLGGGRTQTRILVLLPSLALIRQMLEEWSIQQPWGDAFRFCCVCSDHSVAERDEVIVQQEDVPFPVTTDPEKIREFLLGDGIRVVFSTYQSAGRVAHGAGALHFDLGVFDEAHRTAKGVNSEFSLPLNEEHIPIAKRLFMTATRRVFSSAAKDRAPVASMDDQALYGEIAYSLSFRQAADLGIICRPKVLVSVVTRCELRIALKEVGVVLDGNAVALRDIAGRYALAEAMRRYDLKKGFTFHATIARAKDFVDGERLGVQTFLPDYKALHVSGGMRTSDRDRIMDEFKGAERGVVSNSRCLNEGVDVPAVDIVGFMDPKKSMIDIVQAIGRALRLAPGKRFGYVLLPIFIDQESVSDIDNQVWKTQFNDVWYVLRALMDQDRLLTETINRLRVLKKCGQCEPAESLSEFLSFIGSAQVEEMLRASITVALVEQLGDNAKRDCGIEGPLKKTITIDHVTRHLSARFGKPVRQTGRGQFSAQDGSHRCRISVSNAEVYLRQNAYFNRVTPDDFNLDFYVIWSEYNPLGFIIPAEKLRSYLEPIRATEKNNGKLADWNPVTYFDAMGAYMLLRDLTLNVSPYRVEF
jgi:predicted helicase